MDLPKTLTNVNPQLNYFCIKHHGSNKWFLSISTFQLHKITLPTLVLVVLFICDLRCTMAWVVSGLIGAGTGSRSRRLLTILVSWCQSLRLLVKRDVLLQNFVAIRKIEKVLPTVFFNKAQLLMFLHGLWKRDSWCDKEIRNKNFSDIRCSVIIQTDLIREAF